MAHDFSEHATHVDMSDRSARLPTDWPLADHSSFVVAEGMRWHVQTVGHGKPILLLHGAGASTHSWHGMFSALAKKGQVVAIDLPGHGLSDAFKSGPYTLQRTARALAACLKQAAIRPAAIIGHSAGAAIGLQMQLSDDGAVGRCPILAFNPALLPFNGFAGVMFPVFAKLAAHSGLMRVILSRQARDPKQLRRVLAGTGSTLSQQQLDDYLRLMQQPDHVSSVLSMMAGWQLDHLLPALRKDPRPLYVWMADNDKAVPPRETIRALQGIPKTKTVTVSDLGHLMHEEAPDRMLELINDVLSDLGEDAGHG